MREPSTSTVSRRRFLWTASGAAALSAAGGTGVAQEGTTQTVDMTDDLRFVPATVTVAPGDTVVWENIGSVGHTVTAYGDRIPDGASYFASGDFDSESAARGGYPQGEIPGGETYEHAFQTEGTYEYFCIPHESAGMTGTVQVAPGGGTPTGGGGPDVPLVPDSARLLSIAAFVSLIVVVAFGYFFLKYGGDYESK